MQKMQKVINGAITVIISILITFCTVSFAFGQKYKQVETNTEKINKIEIENKEFYMTLKKIEIQLSEINTNILYLKEREREK